MWELPLPNTNYLLVFRSGVLRDPVTLEYDAVLVGYRIQNFLGKVVLPSSRVDISWNLEESYL